MNPAMVFELIVGIAFLVASIYANDWGTRITTAAFGVALLICNAVWGASIWWTLMIVVVAIAYVILAVLRWRKKPLEQA